ncbi:hypothetical protein D3W54_07025 [Komagataeibacter medellinensis]|uniref:Phage head morphogenesis domain-containing protein n=1 Tax=Komagataeibacter medellinensis TaxID=1177712 RepID=A0ABQ6VUW2_9PROT|nr:phage minor head protein [Komagataeibacter medellinensis]KAB8123994.1 hypothetical protein D3W54_07025 [Komagataeibacter medellinensis]
MPDSVAEAARLPPSEALAFFRQKLNVPTTHWTDLWQQAHARGFMVAGAAEQALLADLRKAVDQAIAGRLTIQEFRKEFDGIVVRHGWAHTGGPGWRSDLIFNVNVSMANAAGRYARMTTPEALEMYPYWMYRHNACQHPRPLHLAWDGTLLPANDPWFDTHFAPNGWRCHCEIVPVSRWMMRKREWSVSERPALDLRPWRNPCTGQVIEVPAGIDPGFAYNPGKAWQAGQMPDIGPTLRPGRMPPATDAGPAQPTPGVTPTMPVPAEHSDQARQAAIVRLLEHPVGVVDAGELPDHVRQALGAKTSRVLLSGATVEKQILHHPELTVNDYRQVPHVLSHPTVSAHSRQRHVMLLSHAGHLYRAVVKVTGDGEENFLQSFHRTTAEKARSALSKMQIFSGSLDDLEADAGDGENDAPGGPPGNPP